MLKLLKTLYGLKQSGRCWNATIDGLITSLDFKKSKLDPCIYYKRNNKGRVMMMWLYVDDVLFAFHDDEELQSVTTKLEERFSIKMLGPVRKFLEITVHETEKRFFSIATKHGERRAAYFQCRARENCCDADGCKY